MLPPDTNILKLLLIHAVHPTPEDVCGTFTKKNLQTRHKIPAVMVARERKIIT